ncbi:MAG: RHS repeat-associated core domain-containing protein, partial [Candidatus Saccharimonadales bacterium]
LIDADGTHLVDYTRIGVGTFVQSNSPQPQIAWSLISGTSVAPYSGLDQFNRVVDNRWYNTATSADLDRIQHGYNRASNRLWRKNTVAEAAGVFLDELYAYDGVYRLARLDRGQLNSTNNGIVAGTEGFTQAWGLDATGNWSTFNQADTGGAWTLQQNRTANAVNEITGIAGGGWIVPAYDVSGNMVTMPQAAAPISAYSASYDAWNRLVSVRSGSGLLMACLYDGLYRRSTKQVAGNLRHFYYSDEWRDLEERLDGSNTFDRQFIWGLRYADEPVARDRANERYYAVQDANWNVTGIADAGGAIQERYQYLAYGASIVLTASFVIRSASVADWEIRFAGYRWEEETALYDARYRCFHSSIGVWLTRDPIATMGPG